LTCALATTALPQCAGTFDAASFLLDWRFAPKWDTYIGTMYNWLSGGLNNGYLAKDNLSTVGPTLPLVMGLLHKLRHECSLSLPSGG
jgi:hypothetical protein